MRKGVFFFYPFVFLNDRAGVMKSERSIQKEGIFELYYK
jgi:hypothetical protein